MSSVVVERDAEVAVLRLNRPERMNAIDEAIRRELPQALAALDADPSARAVVIAGTGEPQALMGALVGGSKS